MQALSLGTAIGRFFGKPSVLPRLILLNVSVFVLIYTVNLIVWLFQIVPQGMPNFFLQWLAVPSDITKLMQKPWTIFTYMFFHQGFLHLLFNMWMLYFGGTLFLQYLNDRQLLATYIYGGLAGALAYILSYNFFPVFLPASPFAVALGASASVLAVLVAIAAWVPNFPVTLLFIGTVRIKYIALALVIIDFLSVQGSNPGGHLAHLGGALWGVAYAAIMRKGLDPANIFYRLNLSKTTPKYRANFGKRAHRPISDEEYNYRKAAEQKIIDAILDKIAKSGYDSLSSKEKEILFRSSNRK